jgi:hypothetical protein
MRACGVHVHAQVCGCAQMYELESACVHACAYVSVRVRKRLHSVCFVCVCMYVCVCVCACVCVRVHTLAKRNACQITHVSA